MARCDQLEIRQEFSDLSPQGLFRRFDNLKTLGLLAEITIPLQLTGGVDATTAKNNHVLMSSHSASKITNADESVINLFEFDGSNVVSKKVRKAGRPVVSASCKQQSLWIA